MGEGAYRSTRGERTRAPRGGSRRGRPASLQPLWVGCGCCRSWPGDLNRLLVPLLPDPRAAFEGLPFFRPYQALYVPRRR
jgi:hypothetical protein